MAGGSGGCGPLKARRWSGRRPASTLRHDGRRRSLRRHPRRHDRRRAGHAGRHGRPALRHGLGNGVPHVHRHVRHAVVFLDGGDSLLRRGAGADVVDGQVAARCVAGAGHHARASDAALLMHQRELGRGRGPAVDALERGGIVLRQFLGSDHGGVEVGRVGQAVLPGGARDKLERTGRAGRGDVIGILRLGSRQRAEIGPQGRVVHVAGDGVADVIRRRLEAGKVGRRGRGGRRRHHRLRLEREGVLPRRQRGGVRNGVGAGWQARCQHGGGLRWCCRQSRRGLDVCGGFWCVCCGRRRCVACVRRRRVGAPLRRLGGTGLAPTEEFCRSLLGGVLLGEVSAQQ